MSYSRELSTVIPKGVFLSDTSSERRAANALVHGRRLNRLSDRMGIAPEMTLETAYTIQKYATDLWDDQLAGWKIGRLPASLYGPGSTPRFVGPIFAKTVRKLAGPVLRVPFPNAGQNAVEAEFLVRLAKPLRSAGPDVDEGFWMAHIGAIHTGVELAGNNLAELDRTLRFAEIAAFGNNRGLLIGDRIPPDYYRRPLQVTSTIEGKIVGSVAAPSPWDIVTSALTEAVTEAAALDVALEAGHWIATGALTGIHSIAIDQSAIVQFEGYKSIEMITSDIRKWQDAYGLY